MDKLKLELKLIIGKEFIELENILFKNIAYIKMKINFVNILEGSDFEGSFAYFNELKKSCFTSGRYLIFTSVNGVADDAGWDYIEVFHNQNSIDWNFERNATKFSYKFEKKEYINIINQLENLINTIDSKLILEPSQVIFPEEK